MCLRSSCLGQSWRHSGHSSWCLDAVVTAEGGTLGPCRDGRRHVGYVWQEERGVWGMINGGVGKRACDK